MPRSDVTAPDDAGWKLTYGEHFVTPAPGLRHQAIMLNIASGLEVPLVEVFEE